jgi:hypothetical protein
LRDLSRALPRPETLTGTARQRFDLWSGRLGGALAAATARKRGRFDPVAALIRPQLLAQALQRRADRLGSQGQRLRGALTRLIGDAERRGREEIRYQGDGDEVPGRARLFGPADAQHDIRDGRQHPAMGDIMAVAVPPFDADAEARPGLLRPAEDRPDRFEEGPAGMACHEAFGDAAIRHAIRHALGPSPALPGPG